MFRLILCLVSLLLTVMGHGDKTHDEVHKHCHRVLHRGPRCCEMNIPDSVKESREAINKECSQVPGNTACDRLICVYSKFGVANADGTIDKPKIAEMVEKDMEKNPEILAAIKEKCIDGDLSVYGPEDECEVKKIEHCFDAQVLKRCPKWNNEDECEGMEKSAAECLRHF